MFLLFFLIFIICCIVEEISDSYKAYKYHQKWRLLCGESLLQTTTEKLSLCG